MKRHTSNEWLDFFGIEMIDDDGWRHQGQSCNGPEQFTVDEFVTRLNESTICYNRSSLYQERRLTLDFIS